MDKHAVIATLQKHRADLERQGVLHAAVFGSVARGEAGPKSDIDILIDIEPERSKKMGVFEFVGIQLFIEDLFDRPVDVVEQDALKPMIKPTVLRDAVYAF